MSTAQDHKGFQGMASKVDPAFEPTFVEASADAAPSGMTYAERIADAGFPLHGFSDETTAISASLLEKEVYRHTSSQRDSADGGSAPGLTARLEPVRQAFASSLYVKDAGRHKIKC